MTNSWWPTAGRRETGSGALVSVGTTACYWSSTYYSTYQSYRMAFNHSGVVYPSTSDNRSIGFSVRCVQEERLSE